MNRKTLNLKYPDRNFSTQEKQFSKLHLLLLNAVITDKFISLWIRSGVELILHASAFRYAMAITPQLNNEQLKELIRMANLFHSPFIRIENPAKAVAVMEKLYDMLDLRRITT